MVAFWSLFLLLGYGLIRPAGLSTVLRGWLRELGGPSLAEPWVEPFPILRTFDLAMAICLGVLFVGGLVFYGLLQRPKVADMLIDTDMEMRKVTWPSMSDTWKGAVAVVATVVFMLAYLTGADIAIQFAVRQLMGAG